MLGSSKGGLPFCVRKDKGKGKEQGKLPTRAQRQGNGKHCVNRYVTRAKLCTSRNREVPAFFRTFRTTIKKPARIKDAGRYHHQATALAQIIHHLQHWGRLIQRVEVQARRAAVQQAFTQASHYIGTKGGNGVAVIAVGF